MCVYIYIYKKKIKIKIVVCWCIVWECCECPRACGVLMESEVHILGERELSYNDNKTYITCFISITMFYGSGNISHIFLGISHVHTGCGKYMGIFGGIVPISHNILMGTHNVTESLE